jgi:hypothetical protein
MGNRRRKVYRIIKLRPYSHISPSSSGAGKTQLALQLSLFVQVPKEIGGLAGSVCYLTTSSKLPTARLLQISQTQELLSPSFCSLEDVHTISIPTSDFLQHVLTTLLPSFIQKQGTIQGKKPVKLVIIDALAELFHGIGKTTTSTLIERKQSIARISASLHEIASTYSIAMVILNEVVDNFDRGHLGSRLPGEMTYQQQSCTLDEKKKAALGPAWTNQVNAKIMLSRTGRRRQLRDEDFPIKRRQLLDNQIQSSRASLLDTQEPTLIRCLKIIFSSVSAPTSLDFTVSECGISVLQDNTHTTLISDQTSTSKQGPDDQRPIGPSAEIQLETTSAAQLTNEAVAEAEDEYDKLWTEDTYNDFDWDALEQVLTQTV